MHQMKIPIFYKMFMLLVMDMHNKTTVQFLQLETVSLIVLIIILFQIFIEIAIILMIKFIGPT